MPRVRVSIVAWKAPCGLRVSPDNIISNVAAGSVAELAGCTIGDKIVSINDISTAQASLTNMLSSRKVGTTVIIELQRGSKTNAEDPQKSSSGKSKAAAASRKRKADEQPSEQPPKPKASKNGKAAGGKAAEGKAAEGKAAAGKAAAGKKPVQSQQLKPIKPNPTPKPVTKWPKALCFRDYTRPDDNFRISELELGMMKLCGAIRNKKGWTQKLADPRISCKWAEEAASQFGFAARGAGAFGGASRAVQLALDELRWQAGEPVLPGGVEGTFAADDALPAHLHDALTEGFATLSSVPNASKDWHPGSDGQVLDLVHPSLYCYEHGVTPVLNGDLKSSPLPLSSKSSSSRPSEWEAFLSNTKCRPTTAARARTPAGHPIRTTAGHPNYGWASDKGLAWLPAEFALSADGTACKIQSYINNLDPAAHSGLYEVIGACFTRMAPRGS